MISFTSVLKRALFAFFEINTVPHDPKKPDAVTDTLMG
jgi:hypothetical protein